MNSIFAVWCQSEKHSIYIEILLQKLLLSSRFQKCLLSLSHIFIFTRVIEHRKSSFKNASIESLFSEMLAFAFAFSSLSYILILIRIIQHRKPSREPCHPRGLDLSLIQDDRAYFTTALRCLKLNRIISFSWIFLKTDSLNHENHEK